MIAVQQLSDGLIRGLIRGHDTYFRTLFRVNLHGWPDRRVLGDAGEMRDIPYRPYRPNSRNTAGPEAFVIGSVCVRG